MTIQKNKDFFTVSFCRDNIWLIIILLITVAIICVSLINPPPLYRVYTLADPAKKLYSPYPFTLSPFEMTRSALGLRDWLYLSICYFFVMLFGQALFKPFWSDWAPQNRLARVFCSFFVGYIATVGFARILSLLIDAKKLHIVTMCAMGVTVLISYLNRSEESNRTRSDNNHLLIWCTAAVILVAAALAIQVFQVDFSWHTHFGEPTIEMEYEVLNSKTSFFPISFSYYDSALFHYVTTYPIADKIHVILPWWLTLAIIKLSVFIFIYGIFRTLKMPQQLSLASTLFLFFGTVSPFFTRYYLLFDYGNPLFLDMDSSRMAALAAFLLVVLSVAKQHIKIGWIALFLFSLGVSSLVTSHVAWILLAWLFTWFFGGKADVATSLSLSFDRFICITTVAAWILLFALPFDGYYRLRLIACIIPIVAWAARYILNHRYFTWKWDRNTLSAIIANASTASGLLFLGNLFVNNKLAKTVFGIFNRSPHIYGIEWATKVYDGNYMLGDFRDFSRMDLHAQFTSGATGFLCFYGGILLMILFSQHWTQQKWKTSAPERTAAILHEFFLVTVIVLPILFFFMNFINIGEYAWYKVRFTQIPIIYIQFYFLYTLSRLDCLRRPMLRNITICSLLLLCIVPFLATQRPGQMLENLRVIQPVFGG